MSTQDVNQVLELLRTEGGINLEAAFSQSAFQSELLCLMPQEGDGLQTAQRLTQAMETLLTRQFVDSKLIVAVCVAIKKMTGLPMAKVLRRVEQARGHLKLPSPSWVGKNMRAANVIDAHPNLGDVGDTEKLCALERLPEEVLREVSVSGKVGLGDKQVDVRSASRSEIGAAIREVRGQHKRVRKQAETEGPQNVATDREDDDRPELLVIEGQQLARVVTGASREEAVASTQDRIRAIDLFLDNFLTGDRDGILTLQMAASEHMLERLMRCLPEDERYTPLRDSLETSAELLRSTLSLEAVPTEMAASTGKDETW